MNHGDEQHAALLGRREDGARTAYPDSLAKDIAESNGRLDDVFGGALEQETPFVIKRTTIVRKVGGRYLPSPDRVVEYYGGIASTERDWYTKKPSWTRCIANAVGFPDRESAQSLIEKFGLKPRAEVVERKNEGR